MRVGCAFALTLVLSDAALAIEGAKGATNAHGVAPADGARATSVEGDRRVELQSSEVAQARLAASARARKDEFSWTWPREEHTTTELRSQFEVAALLLGSVEFMQLRHPTAGAKQLNGFDMRLGWWPGHLGFRVHGGYHWGKDQPPEGGGEPPTIGSGFGGVSAQFAFIARGPVRPFIGGAGYFDYWSTSTESTWAARADNQVTLRAMASAGTYLRVGGTDRTGYFLELSGKYGRLFARDVFGVDVDAYIISIGVAALGTFSSRDG